jgi:hypothetical protein
MLSFGRVYRLGPAVISFQISVVQLGLGMNISALLSCSDWVPASYCLLSHVSSVQFRLGWVRLG